MEKSIPTATLEKFTTFGDLLRFLRRRAAVTQLELASMVGYSDGQISRLEQNLRLPDIPTIEARFVSALDLDDQPEAVGRLLDLASNVRREDAPTLGTCPYKGLSYFDESDADLFVGRETVTERLVERVSALASAREAGEQRLLAIVGASGSGKSSLVRAGLIPALRWNKATADWQIHALTPTARPLENLATELTWESASVAATASMIDDMAAEPRSLHLFGKREAKAVNASHLLLVVDQFEELFTLCRSDDERLAFINNLCSASSEAAGPVVVIIALRADFYGHCAAYPQLRQALSQHQEYIGAMSSDDLRRLIEEPARRGRWELEPGLVDLLLHDVGQEPGALPLLSHALWETWQRRRGHTMTLSGYSSTGGVRGAIAETAEAIFADRFTGDQQAIARRIFLRLTELGDETSTGVTRRRAPFSELILKPAEADATWLVLKALADARLITLGQETAEVAHEALIREWPTLRSWLEDNREGLRLHRQLTEAAAEWAAEGRDRDLLFRGARLAQVRDWAPLHAEDLNPLEQEFLQASTEFSEWEAAQREAQRQMDLESAQKLATAEGRANAQLRKRALYLGAALAVTLAMAVAAVYFADQARLNAISSQQYAAAAQSNADSAEAQSRISTARELAAASLSNLNLDPERSILLALRAVSTTFDTDQTVQPQAEDALHRAVMTSRLLLTISGHRLSLSAAEYSPDGAHIATAGQDRIAKIWDASTGKALLTLQDAGSGDAVNAVAYSPDGARVATANDDHTVKIWDSLAGRQVMTLAGHSDYVYSVAYSPDGGRLAAAGGEGSVIVWNAMTGAELIRIDAGPSAEAGGGVAFSPDGRSLAITMDHYVIAILDASTGKTLVTLRGHTDAVNMLKFNPDGTRLASVGSDGTARIWDAATGAQQLLLNLSGGAWAVAFSPDGERLATAGDDGTAIVWDAASGKVLQTLAGHRSGVYDVSFSPDGTRLATAGRDGTARVWDLMPTHEFLTFAPTDPGSPVSSLSYSPDGTKLATAGSDDTAQIWDASSGTRLMTLSGHSARVNEVIFSPDGTRAATVSDDKTARIWDVSNGVSLLTLTGHAAEVISAAFSPDGTRLATASADRTARVWDAATGSELLTLSGHSQRLTAIAYSPDGRLLATASLDHTVILWDASSGRQLSSSESPQRAPWALAFRPDGNELVVGRVDGSMQVLGIRAAGAQMTEVLALVGHVGLIEAVAYSPDGKRIATASDDNSVKVWDATTGQLVHTLLGQSAGARGVAFSPDGTRLATAGGDGFVRVYLLRIQDLVAVAKTRLTRTWTNAECQQFLHLETCPTQP